MGKFEGIDPKLVRDLLAEVRQAVVQMRTVESRVTQLMSTAGLSSQSTHRPAQIADACDVMVRDVSARVALLEKKVKQEGATPPTEPKSGDSKPETPKVETPKADDLKPAAPKSDESPRVQDQSVDKAPRDDSKPDPRPESGSDFTSDAKPETGSKGDDRSPREGGSAPDAPKNNDPEAKSEVPKVEDARPETSKVEDARSEVPKVEDLKPAVPGPDDGSRGGDQFADNVARNDPDAKPETPKAEDARPQTPEVEAPKVEDARPQTPEVEAPKVEDAKPETGSKGEERSPRGDDNTSGTDIFDTPKKDHPDDIDQTDQPKVVEVDGVKVLQIPLDSPTAEEVSELLKNIEDIAPLEMPKIEVISDVVGQPGWVEPSEPSASAKPDFPVLDTVEPAFGQTVQPPGTGGEANTQSVGTTPEDTPAQSVGAAPEGGVTQSVGTAVSVDGGAQSVGAAPEDAAVQSTGAGREGSVAQWANDGSDVVSAEASPLDMDALKTLTDNAREIEPLDMPDVRVPDGETWDEGAWAPMDIRPDGPAGDVDPEDPLRSIPPLGGGQ